MSDERLRELERVWRETGAPDDGARWLLERRRAGTLTQERLDLAAYCGHAAAALAGGRTFDPRPTSQGAPRAEWGRGLQDWSVAVMVRYAVAVRTRALAAVQVTLPDVARIDREYMQLVHEARIQAGPVAPGQRPEIPPPPAVCATVEYRFAEALLRVEQARGPFTAALRAISLEEALRPLFGPSVLSTEADAVLRGARRDLAEWALA